MTKRKGPLDELPKGFTCECGTFHRFAAYVYGHWRDELIHTCEQCGAKHSIIEGCTVLDTPGRKL